MSWNSCFNYWECVFWLECCVLQQTKGFKIADKENFTMPCMRAFRRYTRMFILNWITGKHCHNYKIKIMKVFVHVPCYSQFCPDNAYPQTEKLSEHCRPTLTSYCYHSLERGNRIGFFVHNMLLIFHKKCSTLMLQVSTKMFGFP